MNAKDKAKELVKRYLKLFENFPFSIAWELAKQCALIAVDELIGYAKTFGDVTDLDILYFENIKEEIQKL